MSYRLAFLSKMMLCALMLLFLAGDQLAISAPHQNPPISFSQNLIPDLFRLQTLESSPWVYGKGNFEISDLNSFGNSLAYPESFRYQNDRISPDQDVFDESPDPKWAKTMPILGDPGLEWRGFIICETNSCALRKAYICITSRSPPMSKPAQTL
jgi:hypothetical protein